MRTLQGFYKFHQLVKANYKPCDMGFWENISTGDINRFASRIRVAKSFQGINLDGYTSKTLYGYDGFFQVFLTHSALERFLNIFSINLSSLEDKFANYHPEEVIHIFVEKDRNGLLYEFLYQQLESKRLKENLSKCRNLSSNNVSQISASIRHIFAHGHLCAHSGGIEPQNVHTICSAVSDFLLNFIDNEFSQKIEYHHQKLFENSIE